MSTPVSNEYTLESRDKHRVEAKEYSHPPLVNISFLTNDKLRDHRELNPIDPPPSSWSSAWDTCHLQSQPCRIPRPGVPLQAPRCSPIGRARTIPREASFRSWAWHGDSEQSPRVKSKGEGGCWRDECRDGSRDGGGDSPVFDPWTWGKGSVLGDEWVGGPLRSTCLHGAEEWSTGLRTHSWAAESAPESSVSGPELWKWLSSLSSGKLSKDSDRDRDEDEEFSFPILGSHSCHPDGLHTDPSFQLWGVLDSDRCSESMNTLEERQDLGISFSFPALA